MAKKGQQQSSTGAAPIIYRELRTEARNLSNHWLRLLGALGLTVLFGAMLRTNDRVSLSISMSLFTGAHALLTIAIFVVGPALTSDAIGRERREGTLGLLFGTPLTARAILLGKSLVHLVRLITLWLAAFPIVMIPVLLGGVTGLDIVSAVVLETCAVLWSLSAGLLATSFLRHPIAALVAAELFSLVLLILFCGTMGIALVLQVYPLVTTGPVQLNYYNLFSFPLALLTGLLENGGWSGTIRAMGTVSNGLWGAILLEILLLSFLAFGWILGMAAWRTSKVWQDTPQTARQSRRQRRWLLPRFWLGLYAARRRRWLDRNPLGWIQQHSAWGRVQKLGWCGLILLGESLVILSPWPYELQPSAQTLLSIGLSTHMTLAALTIFRKDQDAGVLELLLVTPITPGQVLMRQLRAFWGRFLPPVLLLIGLAQFMVWKDLSSPAAFKFESFLVVNFLTAPLISFFAASHFRTFTAAFFFAGFFSLGLPLMAPELSAGFLERIGGLELWWLSRWPTPPNDSASLDWGVKLIQIAAALVLGIQARDGLANRTFFLRPRA